MDFEPHRGHEQGGRRPGVVLSRKRYNRLTGLAICCPITSQAKGYPMEYPLPEGLPVVGVVLTDQIRNLAWRERNADFITNLRSDIVETILDLARGMLA